MACTCLPPYSTSLDLLVQEAEDKTVRLAAMATLEDGARKIMCPGDYVPSYNMWSNSFAWVKAGQAFTHDRQ